MERVDFDYVGRDGCTIYRTCFERYLNARMVQKRSKDDWSKLVVQTEEIFDFLIQQGNKNGFDVNSILEIPTSNGSTCFSVAVQFSHKISKYILGREIKVNCIRSSMMTPDFTYPDLTVQMLSKGINPHVISGKMFGHDGKSVAEDWPSSFKSEEAKHLMDQFPRSINFSVEDINCNNTCPVDCESKYQRFYFKNGTVVKMSEENKIGQGGFGSVFKGVFHGQKKAMKCVLIGEIEYLNQIEHAKVQLEKNISEIRIQMASAGSGVIVPEAFVRQQIQEQDDNGKWIAKNYNVYIYPLFDCNLYDLHENNFDSFNEEITGRIIHQCFNRKGFTLIFSSLI